LHVIGGEWRVGSLHAAHHRARDLHGTVSEADGVPRADEDVGRTPAGERGAEGNGRVRQQSIPVVGGNKRDREGMYGLHNRPERKHPPLPPN